MKRAAVSASLRSLRYFWAGSSSTALLSSQSSYARSGLANGFTSDPVSVGNKLIYAFMPPSLSTQFQRSLTTQSGIRTQSEIVEAFKAATGSAEAVKALKDLESEFGENNSVVGEACLKIGEYMLREGMDPEKTLAFSNRAVHILNLQVMPSWQLATALLLVGTLNYEMNRLHEALGCFDRANHVLDAIGNDGMNERRVRHAVHFNLAEIKMDMGRTEEALQNMRRSFELKESIVEPNSTKDGDAHLHLAKAYVAVLNFNEALPLGLKALEIHESQLGSDSVEVEYDRELLSEIYCELGNYQKALEQNELVRKVLKNQRRDSDLMHAEISAAKMLIALKRFDEAIDTLESVVQQTDDESQTRAFIFIEMAKAFCGQEKFTESKRCLEISCCIFDTIKNSSPVTATKGYLLIALQYETMGEIETAVSLNKKMLSLIEKLPQELHFGEGSITARIGMLLFLSGKISQAVPYLESGAEKLKESLGEKHYNVGYTCKHLGAAYLELERPESAAQMSALAKDILDVAVGPHHAESIESCQILANAYSAMGSYGLAIEFQQRVIDEWESHGPTAEGKLKEAQRFLKELKGKVQDGATTNSILSVCDI